MAGLAKFQNIKTKNPGMRCKVNVMNFSGHDVLTTYAPEVEGSVKVATEDFQRFMDECIAEFPNFHKHSLVSGIRAETNELAYIPFADIQAPDFSLEGFTEIFVQPVPLSGG